MTTQSVPHLVGASIAVTLVAASCGAHSAPSGAWRANARQVVAQLRSDVASVETVGPTNAAAAAQLADISDMFGLLLAYTDLGGCNAMVKSTGAPPSVARVLARPCVPLQHASALFVQANKRHDAAALVAATHTAAQALPGLVTASRAVAK